MCSKKLRGTLNLDVDQRHQYRPPLQLSPLTQQQAINKLHQFAFYVAVSLMSGGNRLPFPQA